MTSNALVESVFTVLIRPREFGLVEIWFSPKDSERSSKTALQIISLLILVVKLRWLWEPRHLHFGFSD